jgi:hypothetical protein
MRLKSLPKRKRKSSSGRAYELVYRLPLFIFPFWGSRRFWRLLRFPAQALELNHMGFAQLYEAQKAAMVDLLRMEVRLSDLRQTAIREEKHLAVQKRALFNLLGYEAVPADARLEDKASTPFGFVDRQGPLVEAACKTVRIIRLL